MSTKEPMELGLPSATQPDSQFSPTAQDIRATRILLHNLGLPTELVLLVLDSARYWTRRTTFRASKLCLLDWNHDLNHSASSAYLSAPVSLRPSRTGETPKIREVEFRILSHDQGWTSELTQNTYKTSSWFEVSIVRGSSSRRQGAPCTSHLPRNVSVFTDVERARAHCQYVTFVPRPGVEMEEQRVHCREMMRVTRDEREGGGPPEEGTHAWYLQGNKVVTASGDPDQWARKENAVENRVRWGCRATSVCEGNEGAGRGEGFVDSLRDGDWIILWARVKRRGWENHVYEASISIRYTMGPSGSEEVKPERY